MTTNFPPTNWPGIGTLVGHTFLALRTQRLWLLALLAVLAGMLSGLGTYLASAVLLRPLSALAPVIASEIASTPGSRDAFETLGSSLIPTPFGLPPLAYEHGVGVLVAGIVFSLALGAARPIIEGGLIVRAADAALPLRTAFAESAGRFWAWFLFALLLGSAPVGIILLLLGVLIGLAFLISTQAGIIALIGAFLLGGLTLVLAVVLSCWFELSWREALLRRASFGTALRRGWSMLRRRFRRALGVWAVTVAWSMAVAIAAGLLQTISALATFSSAAPQLSYAGSFVVSLLASTTTLGFGTVLWTRAYPYFTAEVPVAHDGGITVRWRYALGWLAVAIAIICLIIGVGALLLHPVMDALGTLLGNVS